MENDNEKQQYYSDMKGTGAISSIIFSISITLVMWLLSHFFK